MPPTDQTTPLLELTPPMLLLSDQILLHKPSHLLKRQTPIFLRLSKLQGILHKPSHHLPMMGHPIIGESPSPPLQVYVGMFKVHQPLQLEVGMFKVYRPLQVEGTLLVNLFAVHDGATIMVAQGKVHDHGNKSHEKSIPQNHVRVEVITVIGGHVELPTPTGDLVFVADAEVSFSMWPHNLVGAGAGADAANIDGLDDSLNKIGMLVCHPNFSHRSIVILPVSEELIGILNPNGRKLPDIFWMPTGTLHRKGYTTQTLLQIG